MNELKGLEPVAWQREDGTFWRHLDSLTPPPNIKPLYPADQLSAVVQQRDELLKSMKYLQEYRLWVNGHAKTIIDSAIAKVQP